MVGKNGWGEVKNGIGNREVKEFICTNHGHELSGGNAGGLGDAGLGGIKGRKILVQL